MYLRNSKKCVFKIFTISQQILFGQQEILDFVIYLRDTKV